MKCMNGVYVPFSKRLHSLRGVRVGKLPAVEC